jgi:hypothetical protein
MSGKNRAFALAVATAALVGMSAPVASAATVSSPSGFNNDSIFNISGNQLPVQACNDQLPVNAGGNQTDLSNITTAIGLGTLGTAAAANTSCTQNPAVATTETTTTSSESSEDPEETPGGTSGFNNDSILNLSGNQLPVQACNDSLPTNGSGNQFIAAGLVGALGILTPGDVSAAQDSSCTQNPAYSNNSTVGSGSN